MLFKRIALTALILALPACSLRLNEEMNQTKITVNPAKEGCLANASATLDRYFAGAIEDQELEAFWNCAEKAFAMFAENTKGQSGDHYTPTELSSFLTKYFLKGKAIDPELVTEAMALKQGLLGGSSERISRAEIQQILALLKVLHQETRVLRPFMPITAQNFLDKKYTPEQFELALSTFEASMGRVGKSLADVQGSYSFDRMADLLRAMKKFLYERQTPEERAAALRAATECPAHLRTQNGCPVEENWVDIALRWTTALRPAKAIFVAPPKDEIAAADWAKIYDLAPRYYGLYLKARFYLNSDSDYSYGPGLRHLETLANDFSSLMELVLSHRENGTVAASEVDELLTALDQSGMLPVKLGTARTFARALFGRMFSGSATLDDYSITKATFERLREVFLYGTEGLRGLEGFYRERLKDNFDKEPLPRAEVAGLSAESLLKYTAEKNEVSHAALSSLRRSADEVRTIFPNESTTVYVPKGEERHDLSLQHMTKIHLFRSINRLLVQAYGPKNSEALTEQQVESLANDFFPFLEDLGLVDESTRQALPKRLLEGSLFLYSSDGDRGISMTEALEFESLLLSTVLRATKLHAEIAKACVPAPAAGTTPAPAAEATAKPGKKKPRAKVLIPARCYRAEFLATAKRNWAYIPGLADYMASLSKNDQQALFLRMERFLRKGKGDQDFAIGDTQAFILLPYYVEILFSRFDRDRNGIFDNAEAEAAYPVFQPFLKEKSEEHGLTKPEDHKAVFNFLLAYQELPTNMKATWIWRRYIAGHKSFRVDRGQVIQIFEKLLSF